MSPEDRAIIEAAVRYVNFPGPSDNPPEDDDPDSWLTACEIQLRDKLVDAVRDAGRLLPSAGG
jgi:hypothetical protein